MSDVVEEIRAAVMRDKNAEITRLRARVAELEAERDEARAERDLARANRKRRAACWTLSGGFRASEPCPARE